MTALWWLGYLLMAAGLGGLCTERLKNVGAWALLAGLLAWAVLGGWIGAR